MIATMVKLLLLIMFLLLFQAAASSGRMLRPLIRLSYS